MIDPKNDILLRVFLVYFVVALVGLFVILGIVKIQVKDKEELLEKASKRELKFRDEKAHRGNIMSKNGTLLSTSVPRYSIHFDPMVVNEDLFKSEVSLLADSLSRLLRNKSKSQYLSYLNESRAGKKRYVWIANKISVADYKRMQNFPIFREGKNKGGFIAERTYVREKPYGKLASRTIGYVADKTFVGLEGAYDEALKGKDGKQLVRRINGNFWMPMTSPDNEDPINGDDIYTSIDVEIQDVAESALEKCLVENDALQGCVILMDVKSGFVESIVSLTYNEKKNKYEESYNFAIGHGVEPGSTFKAVTMLALLENDPSLNVDKKIYLGTVDYKQFFGYTMRDSHLVTDENGYTTIRNAFEQSSNIAFATLVLDAFEKNPEKYIENIYKTKVNEPLNLDIKGEDKPDIKNTKDKRWSKLSLPWMSIGYELRLTPMQVLTFYNAIANDGVMVKPQFVKEIRHGNEVKHVFDTIVINERIASDRTIKTLQSLLKGVVENGTAKSMNKLGFSVAGKTGTAQISQGSRGYTKKNYTATFVGYFPADNPKYSCIIVVSNPRGKKYYGASVSGPVFKELAEKVYATRLGVLDEKNEYPADCNSFVTSSMVNYDDFVEYCDMENVSFTGNAAEGKWVAVEQVGDKVFVNSVEIEENKVPDVTGMNITDAVCLLESMGWKVKFEGYGKVASQSVQAGMELKKGSVINIVLN